MKKVERQLGEEAFFITVMTSASTNYGDGATVKTARAWAGQHGLDAELVVAADLWSKTVPEPSVPEMNRVVRSGELPPVSAPCKSVSQIKE